VCKPRDAIAGRFVLGLVGVYFSIRSRELTGELSSFEFGTDGNATLFFFWVRTWSVNKGFVRRVLIRL
jgi:hypothetical protein